MDGAAVKAQRSGALSYCSACLGGEPERAGRQLHGASHTRKSSADFRAKACLFFICHIWPCPFSAQRRPPTHSGGRRCILIFGSMQEGRRKRTVCSGSSAISIRAPVGGEVSSRTSPAQSISKFQYTPLCRGRRTGLRISELCGLFQFPPCVWGDVARSWRFTIRAYFNSHPRVWGDDLALQGLVGLLISIPAPVWGATGVGVIHPQKVHISIHAPVWGATKAASNASAHGSISIHAPVWGATCRSYATGRCRRFQFTPPCGGRRGQQRHQSIQIVISIHAPVWGATVRLLAVDGGKAISIHAPVWGATDVLCAVGRRGGISIHAPVWGATRARWWARWWPSNFNSRPRVGGDSKFIQK